MRKSEPIQWVFRVLIYVLGLFFMAIGVAISVNANLGISPVNSLPYVISRISGFALSSCVIGVFTVYIIAQIVLLRKEFKWINLTQLIFSTIFGYFVDFAKWLLDKIQQLYDRLDAGLHGHYSEWNKLSADVLVSLSRQITAIRDAHEYLTEAHDFEPSEVDYLLSLDDPLQAVANKWMERIGDLSDFSFAMDELLRCQNAPTKKSALAQLHEKAAAVPSVPGEKSTSKLKKEEVR